MDHFQTHVKDRYLVIFFVNQPPYAFHWFHWWLVNIDTGNGLVPPGIKPLHKPLLTKIHDAIWRLEWDGCHMMTSSNENIFRVTGPLCGKFTGHRWIPHTKASDAELWCFIDLRLNQSLSKQLRSRCFETPTHSLWRHCNENSTLIREVA